MKQLKKKISHLALSLAVGFIASNISVYASTAQFEQLIGVDSKTKFQKESGSIVKHRVEKKSKRNKNPFRDFDNSDLQEYYSLHLNEFRSNPDYPQMFPTYNEYFNKVLKENNKGASISTGIITKRDNTFVNMELNPKYLYQVDYLLASKGKESSSGFGHSMLRLVFCDPSKVTKGGVIKMDKSCLDHHNFHTVVTYRANISELQTSLLKGIFGGYQSRLFLSPFNEIKKEYNDLELRDLFAYKLNLTDELKTRLVHRVLENYWTYKNDYYFISNNCATETASLVDSILWDKSIRVKNNQTPYGLVEEFKKKKLITEEAITFKSYQENYDTYVNIINQSLALNLKLKDLEELTATERFEIYKDMFNNNSLHSLKNSEKRKLVSSLRLLERRILSINESKAMDKFTELYKKGHFTEQEAKDILELGTISDNMEIVGDASIGIPLEITNDQLISFEQNLIKYLANLNNIYKTLFQKVPELTKLNNDIKNNLDFLSLQNTTTKE